MKTGIGMTVTPDDRHRLEGCMQRHRHQEFIRFLNTAEAAVPAGKVIPVILDNYATHKDPKVRQWLARHPDGPST